jgi:hypothetical protein
MKLTYIVACLALLTSLPPQGAFAAESPESVITGAGKVKFDALLQAWMLNDTTPTSGAKFNFRIRRAELKLSGSVAENSRWFVMIDPAKSLTTGAVAATNDNKILQDLGVAFKLCPGLELIAGEFKIPTTAEGIDWAGELLLPERAFVARNYGEKREPGLMLVWQEGTWKVSGMIHNGQKTNVDDVNNDKDLSFRVDATPIDMLKVGAYTQAGDYSYGTKARWGANARATFSELLVRGEVVYARDSGVKSVGWVGDVAYQINDHFQPVARIEGFDNSVFSSTAASFGLNYYFSKNNAKVQAAYTILNNMNGASGSYTPLNDRDGSLFTVAFQAGI